MSKVYELWECPRKDCGRHRLGPFTCKGVGSDRHKATDAEPFFVTRLRDKPVQSRCGKPLVQAGTDCFCTKPENHDGPCVWKVSK